MAKKLKNRSADTSTVGDKNKRPDGGKRYRRSLVELVSASRVLNLFIFYLFVRSMAEETCTKLYNVPLLISYLYVRSSRKQRGFLLRAQFRTAEVGVLQNWGEKFQRLGRRITKGTRKFIIDGSSTGNFLLSSGMREPTTVYWIYLWNDLIIR